MVGGPKWIRQLLAGVTVEEVQRFDAALDATRTALERRPQVENGSWRDAAQNDIANAEGRRATFKLEAAWSALKSARREMTRSFDPSELVAEARVVRHEADDKLTGWRQKSVADLLPIELLDNVGVFSGGMTVERTVRLADSATPTSGRNTAEHPVEDGSDDSTGEDSFQSDHRNARAPLLIEDLRTRLIAAKWVLETHSDNAYHKFRILRRAVIGTTSVYAAFLAVLFTIVAFEWVPRSLIADSPAESPLGSWRLLLVVMTLGIVGALFSSATELRNRDDGLRIPDLRVRYTLMAMRPVVGAAGAVVVITVLQSALGEAVMLQPSAVFGVAIAAGFTERLVTKTVSSAANAIG